MMRESKKKKRAKIAKKHANILMPKVSSRDGITNDDELENDVDNYEDSRIELRESGHNLTSVLMNPRVTLIDNYMDDFDQAQLLPLDSPEFLRAITALHGSSTLGQTSTPSCTSSLLSTAEYYLTPAHHEMNQTGRGSINGSSGSGTSDLNSSTSSIHSAVSYASLALTSSLRDYSNPQGAIASSYFTNSISRNIFHENRRMRSKGLPAPAAVSGSGVIQPSSPAFKSTSDVSYCFAHVPEIFFSHDFSLKDTDIFTEPAATSFHDEVEGVGGALRDDSMLERMKAAPRENDLNGSNVNGGRGSGRYSSALYTVDLDDDDDDDGINDDFDDDEYQDDDAGIINVDKEGGYESCSYHYMTAYLNRPEVKAALHVPQDITWIDCNEDVQSTWPLEDFYGSSLSSFEAAIHRNHAISSANNSANATADSSTGQQVVKLLVYSGDNDIICPTVGTQRWVFELPHETTSLWRPWYFTEKNKASGVGGYVTQFNSSFTLVTLHEGGHMVAAYQPRQAYDMMKTFLNTEDFFTPPDEVKVLKLYYSLTLQEWRIIDKHSSGLEDQGNEQAAEQGSDVGYEFVRDAIRHCLFDNANITISGKLVDVFGVKVHHAYEVDMDATLGVDVGAAPGVPMDDDFLFARQSAQAEASRKLYSYDKEAEDGSSWNGLWYDKREVVVIAVEVVVATFDHLYDLKTELDVAFETSLYTGHLEKTMRKALHARHEMHDRQGSADDALPYSDIVNVVLERRLGESKEWYSADILPSAHKQDFDWDEYIRVWEFGESFEDDDMSGESFRKELELIEYSMINVGIALITFTVTFLVVAGTFYSYRTYHDRLLHRMGYEIQDDFDDMSNYGDSDSGSDDNDDGDGVGGGVEMSDQAGEVVVRGGTGTSTTTLASTSAFVLEVEHDDGTTSALTI
mmetsp:Transcript_9759/g.16200  ORF Transcript_9759/g.16200 Transcript_9759/m.16200 type:complete len:912 (-) Transcript_9759:149-2884(-)